MMIPCEDLMKVLSDLMDPIAEDCHPDEFDLGRWSALEDIRDWLERRMTEAGEEME